MSEYTLASWNGICRCRLEGWEHQMYNIHVIFSLQHSLCWENTLSVTTFTRKAVRWWEGYCTLSRCPCFSLRSYVLFDAQHVWSLLALSWRDWGRPQQKSSVTTASVPDEIRIENLSTTTTYQSYETLLGLCSLNKRNLLQISKNNNKRTYPTSLWSKSQIGGPRYLTYISHLFSSLSIRALMCSLRFALVTRFPVG
jgi:hypothetical protein